MIRDAQISPCGQYRYLLTRAWGTGPTLLFVMLNPSTADATEDDPTIKRCIRFGIDHGFGGLQVVNLYAYRATDPRDLQLAGYPVGPENNVTIYGAALGASAVCVAWGAPAKEPRRITQVVSILRRAQRVPQCLGTTLAGQPRHPLFVRADARLRPWPTAC